MREPGPTDSALQPGPESPELLLRRPVHVAAAPKTAEARERGELLSAARECSPSGAVAPARRPPARCTPRPALLLRFASPPASGRAGGRGDRRQRLAGEQRGDLGGHMPPACPPVESKGRPATCSLSLPPPGTGPAALASCPGTPPSAGGRGWGVPGREEEAQPWPPARSPHPTAPRVPGRVILVGKSSRCVAFGGVGGQLEAHLY